MMNLQKLRFPTSLTLLVYMATLTGKFQHHSVFCSSWKRFSLSSRRFSSICINWPTQLLICRILYQLTQSIADHSPQILTRLIGRRRVFGLRQLCRRSSFG
ncbi:MAG: hypothetical protein KDD43_17300, partial [Bdellovibrionales bacterium]|nr:hypothetical protein [Bdellovibrionales bacterium]